MKRLDARLCEVIDKIAKIARESIMGKETDNLALFDKVQDKGIELYVMKNDKYDGVSMWNKKTHKPQIYLDVDQNQNRQLFTLAHELGHLFIDLGWYPNSRLEEEPKETVLSVNYRDKDKERDTEDDKERIANQFAGAFLMPQSEVEKIISSEMTDEEKKQEISRKFKVTLKAAENRLLVLGVLNAD